MKKQYKTTKSQRRNANKYYSENKKEICKKLNTYYQKHKKRICKRECVRQNKTLKSRTNKQIEKDNMLHKVYYESNGNKMRKQFKKRYKLHRKEILKSCKDKRKKMNQNKINGFTGILDPGIKPLIIFLIDNNINTTHSCTGHPFKGMLGRGYINFDYTKDCNKFLNLINRIDINFKIKKKKTYYQNDIYSYQLEFYYNKDFTQEQIDNEWSNLFLQIKNKIKSKHQKSKKKAKQNGKQK